MRKTGIRGGAAAELVFWVVIAILAGVCFLLYKGGLSFYREHTKPGITEGCFHYAKTDKGELCVTDRPSPTHNCVNLGEFEVAGGSLACFYSAVAASEFVKNSGGKVCSTYLISKDCPKLKR